MKINGYAALQAKSKLEPFSYEPGVLGSFDIEVEISHCGICFSDVHLIDDDWKRSRYPFIPGHEIVGMVVALGSQVSGLKKGDRVGIGWQRSSCLTCEFCLAGNENLCAKQTATCVGHHGGFADRIRADSRFVFPLPSGLDSAEAAPLLCGGATVFSPIHRFGIASKHRVGVIGIGGLGHMALLILKAIGCETTAFSSSESKRAEATAMGAQNFVSSKLPRDILKMEKQFDLLIATAGAKLDWVSFLQTVKPGGTLCLVGAAPGLLSVPPDMLVGPQRSVCGSDIANRGTIREMLAFAEKHKLTTRIELAKMSEVNQGISRLRTNEVRYRMVLENPS
jgi:uncharacterized zinc-type alcohol dehydrogenase-like protein